VHGVCSCGDMVCAHACATRCQPACTCCLTPHSAPRSAPHVPLNHPVHTRCIEERDEREQRDARTHTLVGERGEEEKSGRSTHFTDGEALYSAASAGAPTRRLWFTLVAPRQNSFRPHTSSHNLTSAPTRLLHNISTKPPRGPRPCQESQWLGTGRRSWRQRQGLRR
jgi:hypothetical protein